MMNGWRAKLRKAARAAAAVLAVVAVLAAAGCKTAPTPPPGAPGDNGFTAHIKKITYNTENNRSIVKIFGTQKFEYTAYKLADPLRLAVEIPNAELDFEPRHITVEGKIVSGMMVVRFPKVKSVRLEMELLSDAPFKLTQKADYLEVQLTEGAVAALPRPAQAPSSAATPENAGAELETLRTELEALRTENLALRKESVRLEEENRNLKKERDESAKQMEEAAALSRSLQARVAFMEEQVSNLQSKVGAGASEKPAQTGAAIGLGEGAIPVPIPLPAPEALPAPIASPPPAAEQKPDDEKAKMAVSQAVAAWLNAWREKNFGKYASSYAPGFHGQGMALNAWLADKKAKFSSGKKLSIAAENVKIGLEADGSATVVFEQAYQSGAYKDRGLKRLRLVNSGGNWLIASEEWSPL